MFGPHIAAGVACAGVVAGGGGDTVVVEVNGFTVLGPSSFAVAGRADDDCVWWGGAAASRVCLDADMSGTVLRAVGAGSTTTESAFVVLAAFCAS